jgi:hypothetical protein
LQRCSLFQVTNDMQTMVQRMGSINLLQGHVQVNLVRDWKMSNSLDILAVWIGSCRT